MDHGLDNDFHIIITFVNFLILKRYRENLDDIFEPLWKYTGCLDAPLDAYIHENLTSWPTESRVMLFLILYVGIFQTLLIILHAIIYKMSSDEIMRIGDTGVVEPDDQVAQKTVELPTT